MYKLDLVYHMPTGSSALLLLAYTMSNPPPADNSRTHWKPVCCVRQHEVTMMNDRAPCGGGHGEAGGLLNHPDG